MAGGIGGAIIVGFVWAAFGITIMDRDMTFLFIIYGAILGGIFAIIYTEITINILHIVSEVAQGAIIIGIIGGISGAILGVTNELSWKSISEVALLGMIFGMILGGLIMGASRGIIHGMFWGAIVGVLYGMLYGGFWGTVGGIIGGAMSGAIISRLVR